MPRSPDDRVVVRDSSCDLWRAVADGIVTSHDCRDGKLRPSLTPSLAPSILPTPRPTPAASIRAATPYGRQEPPWTLSTRDARAPLAALPDPRVNILKAELAVEERKRAAAERALAKVETALCEWKGAL